MPINNQSVNEALNQANDCIRKAIQLSMEDIKKDPGKEESYFYLWSQYATKVGQYFMTEAERTGNKQVAKNVKRNIMRFM